MSNGNRGGRKIENTLMLDLTVRALTEYSYSSGDRPRISLGSPSECVTILEDVKSIVDFDSQPKSLP